MENVNKSMDEVDKREMEAFLNDKVHKDLYDKVNANTNAVSSLNATVSLITAQNERFIEIVESDTTNLIKLFKWVAGGLFVLILFLTAALVYGAIGDDGLHSVRLNMPYLPNMPSSPTTPTSMYYIEVIPWHDDHHIVHVKNIAIA